MYHTKKIVFLSLLLSFATLSTISYGSSPSTNTASEKETTTTAPSSDTTSDPTTNIDTTQFSRSSSPYQAKDPLSINYVLDKVEDNLEKNFDKQYKINWDFEIIYHDSKVLVCIDYLKGDLKQFNKLTTEQLSKFLDKIIKDINKNLKVKDVEIHGIINQDDTKTPTYTFMYKNGSLEIK